VATILVELFLELGWAAEINQRPCSLSVRWRRRQGNDHRQQDGELPLKVNSSLLSVVLHE